MADQSLTEEGLETTCEVSARAADRSAARPAAFQTAGAGANRYAWDNVSRTDREPALVVGQVSPGEFERICLERRGHAAGQSTVPPGDCRQAAFRALRATRPALAPALAKRKPPLRTLPARDPPEIPRRAGRRSGPRLRCGPDGRA